MADDQKSAPEPPAPPAERIGWWGGLAARLAGSRAILLRFVILYPVLVIVLAGVIGTPTIQKSVDLPLNTLTAGAAARLMTLCGFTASSFGPQIVYDNRTVAVKTGCSGLELLIVLLPAILVFPSSLKSKAVGFLAAVLFVLPLNTIRVASLSILLAKSTSAFELFHVYFWQALLVGCLFGFFVLWIRGVALWNVRRSF